MNKGILALTLMMAVSSFAQASKVIAERKTSIGFAPPEVRGIYKLQILDNGVVQSIDNHQVVTVHAKLSKAEIQKIANTVEKVKEEELKLPNTPGCMDAPSESISVIQSSGKAITTKTRVACKEGETLDSAGQAITNVVEGLDKAFNSIRTEN